MPGAVLARGGRMGGESCSPVCRSSSIAKNGWNGNPAVRGAGGILSPAAGFRGHRRAENSPEEKQEKGCKCAEGVFLN